MGGHMAANLLKKGHQVVVFDVNAPAVQVSDIMTNRNWLLLVPSLLPVRGIRWTYRSELASLSSTIVTMLPSNPHVESVYLGQDGLASGLRES